MTPQTLDLPDLLAHDGFLRALARQLVLDESRADDVVQQAWLQAIRRPPRRADSPRGWLAAVVRGHAARDHRGENRRQRRERAVARDEAVPAAVDVVAREEQRRLLVDAVLGLPEPLRDVVLLRWFEGMPPRQIAAHTGVPLATVKTRLARALDRLRHELDARHDGDRQRWALALVPLAAPVRGGATGVMAAAIAAAPWVLLVGVFAAAAILLWPRDGALPIAQNDGMHAGTVATASPAAVVREAVSPPPERVPATTPSTVAPSVAAALGALHGRVLLPGGDPAAGVIVRLFAVDPLRSFGSVRGLAEAVGAGARIEDTRTDEGGRFGFDGVAPGELFALHLDANGPHADFRLLPRTVASAQQVDLGDFRLPARGTVTGQVVDEDGVPVADAAVWVTELSPLWLRLAPIDRLQPGAVALLAVPPPPRDVATAKGTVGYVEQVVESARRTPPTAEDDSEYVVLSSPAWVDRLLAALPVANAKTDAEGRFEVVGVPEGRPQVIAFRRGAGRGARAVKVAAGTPADAGCIELHGRETTHVRVVDSDHAPVEGAQVVVAPQPALMSGLLFAAAPARTDADGRLVEEGLPRGDVIVAARRGVDEPWQIGGPVDASDDVEVTLPAAVAVGFDLRGVAADASLRWTLRQGPPLGELADMQATLPDVPRHDAGGRWRLDLPPGTYTVELRAPNAIPLVRTFVAGRDREVVLAPDRGQRTTITVRDEDGQPVAGAQVFLEGDEGRAGGKSILFRYGGLGGWSTLARDLGRTDAGGVLIADALPQPATLVVEHPAFTRAVETLEQVAATTAITLTRGARIDGVVEDYDGSPARVVVSEHVRTVFGIPMGWDGPPPWTAMVPVQDDGRFQITAIPAGAIDLALRPDGGEDASDLGGLLARVGFGGTLQADDPTVLRLAPGETRTVRMHADGTLVFEQVELAGRIRVDGVPVVGAKVSVMRTGVNWLDKHDGIEWGDLGTTDQDGRFRFLRPAIEHHLYLQAPDGRLLWGGAIDLGAADPQPLDLDLHTGVVSVQVHGAGGEPPPTTVTLMSHDSSVPGSATGVIHLDADGRGSVRMPAGRYRLQTMTAATEANVDDVVVAAGADVHRELWLSSDGVFSGTLDLAGRSDPARISMVEMTAVDGGKDVTVSVMEGGFRASDVPAGRYRLRLLDGALDPWQALPAEITVPTTGLTGVTLQVGAKLPADKQ